MGQGSMLYSMAPRHCPALTVPESCGTISTGLAVWNVEEHVISETGSEELVLLTGGIAPGAFNVLSTLLHL